MTTRPVRPLWLATWTLLGLAAGCASSEAPLGTDAGTEVDARVVLRGPGPDCMSDFNCRYSLTDENDEVYELVEPEGARCVEGGCGCLDDSHCAEVEIGASCDVATRACRGCATDAECDDPDLRCVTGDCVECVDASQCGGATPACADGRCVECAGAQDCSASPSGTLCNQNACGCASSADCLSGLVCDGSSCIPACTSDADCGGLACDTSTGECVECLTDTRCVGDEDGTSCLAASRTCGCSTDAHCATSRFGDACIVQMGFCGCVTHVDCPMETPVCNAQECEALP